MVSDLMPKKIPTIVSLFSGAGGMDLGFEQAGFKTIWANDFDEDSTKTYKRNIGDIVLGDIEKIKSKDIPDNPDIVLGGFPCQGFSIANSIRRSVDDSRNKLYKQMVRIIRDKKPKYFVAENVQGILSLGKGLVMQKILYDFSKLGYQIDWKLLNAADYGVPQSRKRVFIIGNRIGKKNPFPKPSHFGFVNGTKDQSLFDNDFEKYEKHISTEEAIGFLTNVRTRDKSFTHKNEWIHNHVADTNVKDEFWGRKYEVNQHEICDYLKSWRAKSEWSVKKIDEHFGYAHTAGHWFRKDNNSGSIPNPDDWLGLKKLLKFDSKYDKKVTTFVKKKISFEQSLRISNWDKPSDTITATSPEIHPNGKRRLSVRECAILQTFPMDFVFEGSTFRSMHRQIGNAVAVKLAYKIATEIKKMI